MRRIRKKIKRRVAALLAACMVTTSVPGNAFGAEMPDSRDSSDPENVVVHLDQERLKTAVENAVRNGDEYSEELKFYTEDEGNSQPELYNALFRDGDLYEVSLEDAAPATPSNAEAEDGEVTILVRPDLEAEKAEGEEKATPSDADSEEKATSSDVRRTGKATGSDADLSGYEATGNEQIIILFRNTGDNEVIYQIEVNGNLTPEISVPAGSTLVSDLASESDAEELEEETETEEPEAEAPAEDGSVPGNGSGGGSGSGSSDTEAPSKEESGEDASEGDSTEDSSENGSEGAPSEEEGGADSSESGNTEDSSEGSGSSEDSSADKENDTENGSGTVKPEGGTDAEAPEQGENGGQDSSEEPDSSENGSDSKEDSQDGADKSDNADSSHKGDGRPESGSSDNGKQEDSKPESGKSESSKSENGSSDSGKSEGSGSEAEKKAEALTISSHLVPRVAAVGPSGEEYDPEASGLTPEEEWELFQAEGEDEEEEDYEEEESYEDELTTMAEISDTGVEGTILEPVLVKREKFSFFRSRMSSSRPVSAAAYVTTLAGLGGARLNIETVDGFTVDLFDYGTFNPWKDGAANYAASNGTAGFNNLVSEYGGAWTDATGQRHRNWSSNMINPENTDFVMVPVPAPNPGSQGATGGATTTDSLIRGIVESQYRDGADGLRFSGSLFRLEKYGNTIFPDFKQYAAMKENLRRQDFANNFKAYYNVPFPLYTVGGEEDHYRFSSEDYYITGTESGDGERQINFGWRDYYSDHPYRTRAGFWPLNNAEYDGTFNKDGNQNFGMKFSTKFYLPEGGMWKEEPLKFTFTGDDDVWVFIDGKLVLDMGGLHKNVIGTIDFSTGYTTIQGNGAVKDYHALSGEVTLGAEDINQSGGYVAGYIYGDEDAAEKNAQTAGIEGRRLEKERCISLDLSKKEHTLDFYLVERAPYGSNCTIDFTLPVMPKGNLNVVKEVQGKETKPGADYKFKVQKKEGWQWADYADAGEEGVFTLKKGGIKSIPLNEKGDYRIAEIESQGAETVTWTGTDMVEREDDYEWQLVTVEDETQSYSLVCTNSFIDRSQTHSLTVTKAVSGDNPAPNAKFPFDITLDTSECSVENVNVTYQVENGNDKPVQFQNGQAVLEDIMLADGESVVIKGLPYETKYTVNEDPGKLENSLYESVTEETEGTITLEDKTIQWENRRKENIRTVDFNVKKEVTGLPEDSVTDRTYKFAVYKFTNEVDNSGSEFWKPYTEELYVNGLEAEETDENGAKCFELSWPDDAEAVIELPESVINPDESGTKVSRLLIREIDNGGASSTSWTIDGDEEEKVYSFDSAAFKPEDVKELVCTNDYAPKKLEVRKELSEGSENPGEETKYTFTVSGGNVDKSFSIRAGSSKVLDAAAGSYTITEEIPSAAGYAGTLDYVDGAERIDQTLSAEVTMGSEDEDVQKEVTKIGHAYKIAENFLDNGNMRYDLLALQCTGSEVDWHGGQVILSSEDEDPDTAIKGLVDKMVKASGEPYELIEGAPFYRNNGGLDKGKFDIDNIEEVPLSRIDPNIDWEGKSEAFVICDGICYEYNEHMKFDVKERFQKAGGGTVQDIQASQYGPGEYVYTGENGRTETLDNVAALTLTMTVNTSSSKNHLVTFYNKWEQNLTDMKIEKTITEADTEDNTFLFEVTGPDNSKFYTSITIPAGKTEGESGFENILAGEYTVVELDHMRYEPIEDMENPQTLKVLPEGENTFTFTNEKRSEGYFSDASIILNEVNEDGTYTQHKDSKEPEKGFHQGLPAAILKDKHEDDGGTAEDGQVPPMD